MKVQFRCKESGNTVSFSDDLEIESMRKEQHYEEIKNESQETSIPNAPQEENANEARKERVLKKRGRPIRTDDMI